MGSYAAICVCGLANHELHRQTVYMRPSGMLGHHHVCVVRCVTQCVTVYVYVLRCVMCYVYVLRVRVRVC